MSIDEKLPEGWELAKIGDITDVIGGSTPSRTEKRYFGGDILWLTPSEIPKETVSHITTSKEMLTIEGFNASGVRWVPKGSVLLTSRASIGYVAIAGSSLTTNQGFASFIIPSGINASYFGWWLRSQKDHLEDIAGGTTFKEISKATLKEIFIPIAPTNEQNRIVATIEEQFTRLDSAVASLKSAKARIKQYRASLLKSAVEGELTKEWRAEYPAEETGEQLLKLILIERRARWEEAELAKMREKGIVPKNNKWKEAYKESQEPLMDKLPELPEGWCWATVEQVGDATEQVVLTGPFGSTLGKEDFRKDGVPLLTIGCLTEQGLSLKKAFYISEEKAAELGRYKVRASDILFSRMASVGRADLVPQELEGSVINYHLMRLRLSNTAIDPLYFISFIRGAKIVTDYIKEVNHGVTRDGINTTQLLGLPIAVPSFSEQVQIVAEVEASLSNIAKLEETTENNLKRAEHERQSILQEAFAGRLVLQDMNDEPASLLLERIREERKKREEAEKIVKASRKGDHVGSAKRRKVGTVASGQQNVGLYEKLVEAGQPLAPDDLFKRVGLRADEQPESVETFYEALHADVATGLIVEERTATDKVLLHAVEHDNENLAEDEGAREDDTILVGEMRKAREEALPNLDELPKDKMRKAREAGNRSSLWDE